MVRPALLVLLVCISVPGAAVQVQQRQHVHALPRLIAQYCTTCHAPAGVAFDLTKPERGYDFRAAMVDAVERGRMPPWMAAPGHRRYQGDRSMPAADKQIFVQWREAGYPREALGSAAIAPADPSKPFQGPLQLDVTASHDYLPDQSQTDDYRCFVVDWPLQQDRFVTGIGVRPGNARISHHAVLYVVGPDVRDDYLRFAADEGGSYRCFGGPIPNRVTAPEAREALEREQPGLLAKLNGNHFWLAHWAPGVDGYDLPKDTGIPVQAGSALIVQMHYYNGFARGERDPGTRVSFKHAAKVRSPAMIWPLSNTAWLEARTNNSLVVPARGEASVQVDRAMTGMDAFIAGLAGRSLEQFEAVRVHSANLHMHLIGASGRVELHRANRKSEVLLDVPRYLFGWQRDFYFADPIRIPRGELDQTRLEVRCTFRNPKGVPVYGGYGSDEEMCYDFTYLALEPK